MKKKIDLQPGQKVKGYGLLNQYGEFEFIPEETGLHKDRMKVLFQQGGVTVKETRDNLLVSLKVKKSNNFVDVTRHLYGNMEEAIQRLRKYEI